MPLLDAGSKFVAPATTVVPRNDHAAKSIEGWDNYSAPTAGFEEQVYFFALAGDAHGETLTMLKNAHSTMGVAIGHNIKQLPCYTLWKNTTAIEDGYVTGLEPGTNFPNPRSFEGEHNRTVPIAGKQKVSFGLRLDFLTSEESVSKTEKQIRKLAPEEARIVEKPLREWCHGVEPQEDQSAED